MADRLASTESASPHGKVFIGRKAVAHSRNGLSFFRVAIFDPKGQDRAMPLYEYHCEQCDQIFEEIQKLGEAAPRIPSDGCPRACDQCPLVKKLTGARHKFKGEPSSDGRGGWEQQQGCMTRVTPGRSENYYGTDSQGRR